MKEERKIYKYEGRTIYQWDEGLDTIYCYIPLPALPPSVKPSQILDVSITSKNLIVGIKGNPPYLNHEFQGIADASQSLWYINKKQNNQQLIIEIQKAQKGVRWSALFKGHKTINPIQQQNLKKKLLLQRFQQQNPNFDFSSAQFNGQVPEARTFMGGPKS